MCAKLARTLATVTYMADESVFGGFSQQFLLSPKLICRCLQLSANEEFPRQILPSGEGVLGNPSETVLLRRSQHGSGVEWHENAVRKTQKNSSTERRESRRDGKSKARAISSRRAFQGGARWLEFSFLKKDTRFFQLLLYA